MPGRFRSVGSSHRPTRSIQRMWLPQPIETRPSTGRALFLSLYFHFINSPRAKWTFSQKYIFHEDTGLAGIAPIQPLDKNCRHQRSGPPPKNAKRG